MFEDKRPRNYKTIGIVVGVAIVTLAVCWWFFLRDTSPTPEAAQNQSVEESLAQIESEQGFDDVRQVNSTEEFSADRPNIDGEMPTSWEFEQLDQAATLQSPDFTFTTTDGAEANGYFRIYLREGAAPEDADYLGRGYASQASEKISYTQPASSQVSSTYLSFFGLDETDNFAYFFVNGNFNLDIGESLGADFGKDDGAYIISGGYASDELEDTMATHKVPLDYFDQTNAYKQAVDIIKSLQIR